MVVVSIIAAVLTLVVPRIGNRNREIKASIRKLAVMSKELHTRAKAGNVTYRLVIDMGSGTNTSESPQTYWVEKSDKRAPFSTPDELIEERKKIAEELENADPEEAKKLNRSPGGFAIDTSIMKEKREVASGLLIRDVELFSAEKSFTEGIVYIHYSPEGLTEEAAIHLKMDEKSFWTVAIHPLTGKAEVIGQDIPLKEIRDQ